MPASYFVDFTAYVDQRKLPVGFPTEVHVLETYSDVENTAHLQAIVNDRFVKMVNSAGLVVLKDPTGIIDSSVISFDRRRFIPWHMLTHMELRVSLIPEPSEQSQDSLVPNDPTVATKQKGKPN